VEVVASAESALSDASWRVSRDGEVVAMVDLRHEGGAVLVSAGPVTRPKPYTFDSLQAADVFITDLLASFAYLGCEVAKT
jgi:hypothetical protein